MTTTTWDLTMIEEVGEYLRESGFLDMDNDIVTEKILQEILSRAGKSIEVATAMDKGIKDAIDACNKADYDVLFKELVDTLHGQLAFEANCIAMDAISRMAADARAQQ